MADIQGRFLWREGDNSEEDDWHNYYYSCNEIDGLVYQSGGWRGRARGCKEVLGGKPEQVIAALENDWASRVKDQMALLEVGWVS